MLIKLILLVIISHFLSITFSQITIINENFTNFNQGFIPQELFINFTNLTKVDELLNLYINNPSSYTYNFGPNILSNILIFEPKFNKSIQYDMLSNGYSQFKLNFLKEQSIVYPIANCTLYYLTSSKLWNKILKENGRILKVDKQNVYMEVNIFGTFCISCETKFFQFSVLLYILLIIILHN